MPDTTTQNFATHARFHPPFHYVLTPLLLAHFLYTAVQLFREPTLNHVDAVVLAMALIVMGGLTRINALKAQDRVILLEEKLRYERVLSADVLARARELKPSQVIALRFAPDTELPGLVRQTLAGQFAKPVDIKKAVGNWRADTYRV